jgi:hypothetical protein
MAAQVPLGADTSLSPWPTIARAVILLTAAIGVLLTAFVWPSVRSSVHDVPIAVAGPTAAVKQLYGAIDVSTGTPQVITASAASAAVAQTLQNVATALSQAQGTTTATAVRDLAPLPADDPRGAGLAAGALPLVMGGLLAALVLTGLVRGTTRRITAALAFAITGGLAVAAILQFWLGSLDGTYLANSGAITLTIAAISLCILGLESLLGYAGLGLGAAAMMLIGNPLSGAATAPEMLPGWSGALGQLLPPGAGGQLLRSTAFFDGHGAAHSVIVLTIWLAFGVVLCLASGLRTRRTASVAGMAAQPAARETA